MLTPSQLLCKVNDHLEGLNYFHEPENLYLPVRYILSMGGKRLRHIVSDAAAGTGDQYHFWSYFHLISSIISLRQRL